MLIEGTPAMDRFFIIQRGKVSAYHETAGLGMQPQTLGPGDFVGVVPCMTGLSQTENVLTLSEVTAIVVRRDQYSDLIVNNTPVALKIVRAFARDMRQMNDILTKLTLKKTNMEGPEQIFSVADYYESMGYSDIAAYGYYQYLKACPGGINAETAKRRYGALQKRTHPVYLEPSADSIRSYPQGTMVFSEGQTGGDMFIIQEGSVRICKVVDGNEVTLALLKKTDMFGEMALLDNKLRSANAIAHEECRLMVVNHTNFDQLITTQPQMVSRLTTTFSERIWSMYRQIANTQLQVPRERMVDMLALEIEKVYRPSKLGQNVTKGIQYQTELTPLDLINMCAISPQEQRLAESQLLSDQNVKMANGRILVPDVGALIKQAAFYRKQAARRSQQ